LLDPNFYRTVIYVAEHSADGAVGLILNRPTEESVSAHLVEWGAYVSEPPVIYLGGPVGNEIAIGMVAVPGTPPPDWNPVLDAIGLIDVALPPESLGGFEAARVFSGYSGWVAGQLEAELSTDSWIVTSAGVDDVFSGEPEALWRAVLRRQNDARSLYASFPADLRSN
jgi:putative transcriptional regulator